MTNSQKRRLWFMLAGLGLITLVVIYRLTTFQIIQVDTLAALGRSIHNGQVTAQPERGIIYDRNMAVLAGNSHDYQIGVSPALVTDAELIATALSPVLQEPRHEILQTLLSNRPFELLAGRVSPEVAAAIRDLPYQGIQIDPLPRRVYPQGELLCHTLGFTDFDGVGGSGLEGYYQNELAGEAATANINISPLTPQQSVIAREGDDLVLTIDRSIQYVVEKHLLQAMATYGARSGTIIVMDPRTGAILAMASMPCFSPGNFFEAEEGLFTNPAVSRQY
jgi:cell division protein FtsI (penicillin-binding protein 3)